MKRIITILLAIIMLVISVPVTLAAGDQLVIDNKNIYEGMNKSYSKGYKPTVKKGKATIILPLIYEGTNKIVGDRITVTPDLGNPADSPFSYSNYQMDVLLSNNAVNDGKSTASSFLVRLEIPLAANRINGTYPVVINTGYDLKLGEQDKQKTADGSDKSEGQDQPQVTDDKVEQSFTVYVTITDGKDPNAQEPIPEPEPEPEPRPEPKIIIDQYELDPEIVAGKSFDVLVRLKNTEKKWSAHNIKVTYKGETEDVLPGGKTNTFFIDEIPKGKTHELTLEMKTRQDADPRPQKILLTIEYEDSARSSYSVNEEILLEIRQPLRLEMDEISIPSAVNAGDSLPITTNIFNMGRSTLYNVRCTLEMPGVIPDGSAYLGNMEPGTSGSAEIYAFFGTLDMGGENKSEDNSQSEDDQDDEDSNKNTSRDDGVGKYGRSEGMMTITYEDEYGDVHTKIAELSTNIERPVFDSSRDQGEEPEEKPDRASQ
ncbi:MAG TPA: hypothetical protein VFD89_07590, partial [Clostridia bacterium]|nr:hypothetical protein [Clostridia bacterium]